MSQRSKAIISEAVLTALMAAVHLNINDFSGRD